MIFGWYEAIKDGIAVAQQADNVPLVRELIDAQKQILDLVDENHKLKEQIKEMQTTADIAGKIERHDDAYITLSDDPDKRIYCSCCWDTKRILVQGQKTGVGTYCCPPAEQMRIMTKRPTINTRRKPLPALGK